MASLRLLAKYRFCKDMCPYSINNYDTLKEYEGSDQEEFNTIVEFCEKHPEMYIKSKPIFLEVFHRLQNFNTYSKHIVFMCQMAK